MDLLGNGKKNTKIYKVLHIASGRYYALKEVEAKSLDKLNEYKVSAYEPFDAFKSLTELNLNRIGRSRATVQGSEPQEHHSVLRLLLLRDDVQYLPYWYSLRVHRAALES